MVPVPTTHLNSHVCFGSKGDTCAAKSHVRFTLESDIKCDMWDRFGPKADISPRDPALHERIITRKRPATDGRRYGPLLPQQIAMVNDLPSFSNTPCPIASLDDGATRFHPTLLRLSCAFGRRQ
jgi:hypothetical protein